MIHNQQKNIELQWADNYEQATTMGMNDPEG